MDPSRSRISQIGQRPDLEIPALNSIPEMDSCRVFVAPIADLAAPGPAKSDWRYRFAAFVRPGPVITSQFPMHDFDILQLPKWMKATIQDPAKRYVEARDRVQELIS